MKYGVLFGAVSALLVTTAISLGGWYLTWLWPAVSFAIVAAGYLCLGPRVYGKSPLGTLSTVNLLLLLPYLLFLWFVWHAVRVFKSERAFDQLNDNVYIGRRLAEHEFPNHIDHVVDLTCEFWGTAAVRQENYHSFQILDGSVPLLDELTSWVEDVAKLSGDIYIHCAEGHGRTGLFASALLIKTGQCHSAEEALAVVKSKRPLVRLSRRQREMLVSFHPTSA